MEKSKITFSQLAESDLVEIWMYTYYKWGEKKADTYYNNLTTEIEYLAQFPKIGSTKSEFWDELRYFHIKNHIVFYEIVDSGIYILRILHQKMDATSGLVIYP